MFSSTIKISILAFLCITLSGCLSFGPLKYKQVRMLKQEGFILTEEGWSLGLPERLLFDFDQSELKAMHLPEINRLSQQLRKYNLQKLKIVGHTDNIGQASYNLTLSQARAQSVANVFLDQGFQKPHLFIIGRGDQQPLVTNNSESNRATNRRVTIVIIP